MSATLNDVLVSDDGENVTLTRSDLPSIANVRSFAVVLTLAQVEEIYTLMRSRTLGADSQGEL